MTPRTMARQTPTFDLLSRDHRKNPHPVWDTLRATDPVHYYQPLDCVLLTRYRDVADLLRETAMAAPPIREVLVRIAARTGDSIPACENFLRAVLFIDKSDRHPPLRRLFAAALNNRPLSTVAPVVTKLTDELLGRGLADGGFDAVTQLCDPLAFRVMSTIVGLDDADSRFVFDRAWAAPVLLNFVPDWRRVRSLEPDLAEAFAFIVERLAERRRAPRADGLSRLVAMADADGGLSDMNLAGFAMFMLFVGSATTAAFLAGSIVRLAADDAIRHTLRDPARTSRAVDELLRLESTVAHAGMRVATPGTVIGGVTAPEGRLIVPLIEAANRDPEVFPDPHAFRTDRRVSSPSLVFGDGAHACLGAMLARMEGRIALSAIAAAPRMRVLTDTIEIDSLDVLRRITNLPISFD